MQAFLWRRTPSIRARMTGTFAIAIALILFTSGFFLSRQTRRSAEKRAHELLTAATQRAKIEGAEKDNQGKSLLHLAKHEQGELTVGGLSLLVLDAKQKTLWRSHHEVPPWPPDRKTQRKWRFNSYVDQNQTLVFALNFDEIDADLSERERLIALLGLIIWGATTLGAWLLVGRTLSPINDLSHQAQNASIERLKVRLSPPSRDAEIVGLVGTLNGLLERLEKESQARGRFYAAASHELRTPLQSLIGELDVILDRPREAADYREALEVVRGQSLHLTSLVQELLQLNQLEMIEPPPSQRLNIADIIDRALFAYQEQITRNELRIERELPDTEIVVPPAHVEMLIRNLVDNATKYSLAGETVLVKLEQIETGVRLTMANSANVRLNEDVSGWFEPFFRPDAARTSGSGGNGLGLAICRAIADCDDWEVELKALDKRVEVCVCWPDRPSVR
jgi:signal transduction histidine kinase